MTDKTYTATEFMVEFGKALAAFGAGKGPDPRGQWDVELFGGRWEKRTGYPMFDPNVSYRWTPGSPFAPHEKKRYITINGKVMEGGVLDLEAGKTYYSPMGSRYGVRHSRWIKNMDGSGWEFASAAQAQAVADELDKLMQGEVR